jgi:spore maturation protein CgeB
MRFVMFYHSLVSDWNHGNAHFLRGIVSELIRRGDEVEVFEPENGWSARNLLQEHGIEALRGFHAAYPHLFSSTHNGFNPRIAESLDQADVVIVHEWNDPALVEAIGEHRRKGAPYRLYFHDTHHRMVTDAAAMERYDLSAYDGVLAYGAVLQTLYGCRGHQSWTWHEAADTRVFKPMRQSSTEGDLVWIGNWGDDERAAELQEFLIDPCRRLRLKAAVYGVRYPEAAVRALKDAGIEYRGWLPNFEAPRVFGKYKVTVHVPRRPYVEALPGIPTIRPFEAMACGIPLVCSRWDDAEHLFVPGRDYLVARTGDEMCAHLEKVLSDPPFAQTMAQHAWRTIRSRHTCSHRVNELLEISLKRQNTRSVEVSETNSMKSASFLEHETVS